MPLTQPDVMLVLLLLLLVIQLSSNAPYAARSPVTDDILCSKSTKHAIRVGRGGSTLHLGGLSGRNGSKRVVSSALVLG